MGIGPGHWSDTLWPDLSRESRASLQMVATQNLPSGSEFFHPGDLARGFVVGSDAPNAWALDARNRPAVGGWRGGKTQREQVRDPWHLPVIAW